MLGKSSRRLFSRFTYENNKKKKRNHNLSVFSSSLKSKWTALTVCHGLMFSAYKLICWVSEWAIRLCESNAWFEWDFIKLKFTLCCHSDCDEHWSFVPSVDITLIATLLFQNFLLLLLLHSFFVGNFFYVHTINYKYFWNAPTWVNFVINNSTQAIFFFFSFFVT